MTSMLPSKKCKFKTIYLEVFFNTLLTSQFVYTTPEDCLQLKNLRLKIQTKKTKKNSLYVFMVVNKKNSLFTKISSFVKKQRQVIPF